MNDCKQLAILKRLSAWLEGITPANGYEFDLTGAVFRGRAVFGSDTPVPCLSLLEAPKPEVAMGAAENDVLLAGEWFLFLQGWAPDDIQNPTDPAYQLKAAVEMRLSDIIRTKPGKGTPEIPEAYFLGGLITGFGIGPGVVRPADNPSSKAFFYIPLKVCLVTDVRNPFGAT
jgi:hypothetical protein